MRIAWWPGHSTGRYAGSTWFADDFALDLDENCVAQVNCDCPGCRWATEFNDLSLHDARPRSSSPRSIKDVAGQDEPTASARTAPATTPSTTSASRAYFMLSSTMPDELREEKGYYTVGGCGGNIAWHTEDDMMEIADRDILLRDIKVYLLAVLAQRQCRDPALRLARDGEGVRRDGRRSIRRRPAAAFDLSPSKAAVAELDGGARRTSTPASRRGKVEAGGGQRGDPGSGAHPRADQLHPRERASATIRR